MKILLTGASGYIGSRVLESVVSLYGSDSVIALSSCDFSDNVETVVYDPDTFSIPNSDYFKDVTVILHIGSFTPKTPAQANEISSCNHNIEYTANLLDCDFPKLERIIYLSTLDVYKSSPLISEHSELGPISLYGMSKFYCEKMVEAYANKHCIDITILRIGHVYGPGEEMYQKVIPVTMRKILQGEPIEVWGDGEDKRSFIFIEDVVQSICTALKRTDVPSLINVVSGNAVSILELVKKIISVSGRNIEIKFKNYDGPKRDLCFDNDLIKRYLLPEEESFDAGLAAEFKYMAKLYESNL